MALFPLEASMERACGLHPCLPYDLHGVQVHPLPGPPDGAGEADQMVQTPIFR